METEKLYYQDPYLKEFAAQIIATIPLPNGHWGIVLDRTAFYPESGGQPADQGTINGQAVLHVSEEQGEIIHETAQALAAGAATGIIDWPRRFDHMQQHSGEHLLCGAFNQLLGTANVGFHLGQETSQIDLALENLSPETALQAEELANRMIYENRPVKAGFVAKEELSSYKLRKELTKEFALIRLVDIEDFDCCPCGGTHVARTGEVGQVKILSWERKKNGIRIDFVCGSRALRDYQEKNQLIAQLSARLSASSAQLLPAVERLNQLLEVQGRALKVSCQELNKYKARDMLSEAPEFLGVKLVKSVLEGVEASQLNDLAARLSLEPQTAALLAGISPGREKVYLVFARSPELKLEMNQLLKTALPYIEGRGGGTAVLAQGGGPRVEQAESCLAAAEAALRTALEARS